MRVFIDLDGTCANMAWRNKKAGPEPSKVNKKKYNAWLKKVQSKKTLLEDVPVPCMKELAWALQHNAVYLTARQNVYRDVTKKWLKKHKFPSLPLYMRKPGDWSTNADFKARVIVDLMEEKGYNGPILVIDDDERGEIQTVCLKNNWTFLKATSGR